MAAAKSHPASSGWLTLSLCALLPVASTLHAQSAAAGLKPESCQVAVLSNGFSVRMIRQEPAGAATRLWLCDDSAGGYVEVPSDQIERLEQSPSAAQNVAPESAPQSSRNSVREGPNLIGNLIAGAASRYQIDPDFVTSVVRAESGFNPSAVSTKGAAGLMQLMPRTAASLGIENRLDPAANVEGGTKYLRQLLDRYDGDAVRALAAYNAGPQRVQQYGGVPPYRETRVYITRIIEDYNRKKVQQQSPAAPNLEK